MTDRKPLPMAVLDHSGLLPLTGFDAEQLDAMKPGTVFDLKVRSSRSNPHLRTYWKALGGVVKSTGKWPTPEHLHRELKLACGYVEKVIDWNTGEVHEIPDSIAFDKMTQEEFNTYFKLAMETLSHRVGYDPLRFMERVA